MIQIDLPMPQACDVCPLNYDFCWCKGFKDDEFDKWSDDWNDQVCEGERRPEYCPLKEQEAEMIECEMCGHRLQTNWNWCPWCRWETALRKGR